MCISRSLKHISSTAVKLSTQLNQAHGLSDATKMKLSGTLKCRDCCFTRVRVVPSSITLRKERSIFISKFLLIRRTCQPQSINARQQ